MIQLPSNNFTREAKIRYLCSEYPELIHEGRLDGETPFHVAVQYSAIPSHGLLPAKIICEVVEKRELFRTPVIHCAESDYSKNGWLPLHLFTSSMTKGPVNLLSDEADFFRLMLRWYPEAVGIKAGHGKQKKTPYQLAVARKLDPYYLHLLLRAAPDHNPVELHRLNYAERRMAMFMAFRAVTTQPKPLLLARLRFENKDLVKHVVSFL